ncbi:MAG: CPBP family intramembrane glutamic endopeptidase [Acidobacteriota bacterium]
MVLYNAHAASVFGDTVSSEHDTHTEPVKLMQLPGTPSLFFLFYILLLLPWMAIRSAKRVREISQESSTKPLPDREAIWIGTILNLAAMLFAAWIIGNSFGFEPFGGVSSIDIKDVLAAAATLGVCFILRAMTRALRTDEERRRMVVFRIAPSSPREWALWTLTVLFAGVSEEVAYRGAAMSILWYSLRNPWLAAFICAVAFAVAHWSQGVKSGVVIFAIALAMHALVAITGTLVLAMIVHATYDFVAGYLIAKEARRFDLEAPCSQCGPRPFPLA